MSKIRIKALSVFIAFISMFLIGRLYYLQVTRHSELQSHGIAEMTKIEESIQRGGIYDCLGRQMASSIQVPSAYIVTKKLDNPEGIINAFSNIPWIDSEYIKDAFEKDKGFVWIKRMMNPSQKQSLDALACKEIEYVNETKRFYPHLNLAGQILGFAGTEGKGLEGLEFYFDKFLRRQKGAVPRELICEDADAYYNYDAGTGYDLFLTIDMVIQFFAEEGLRKGCERVDAKNGLLLIMDTYTGEVLAMANWPGYNPNCFYEYPKQLWRNRCVTDMYEPGSIFKVICAAALLEEGLASPDDIIYCEQGSIEVAGRRIRDYKEFGWLSLKQVIERSSNIGSVKFARKLGKEKFYNYIKRFGFTEKTGIDFPGEVKGIVRPPKEWSGMSMASVSIGQEISVTPIQMITAFSALVNDGKLMKPFILKQVHDQKGNILYKHNPELKRRVISPRTSKQIKDILRGVVSRGTGKKADIQGFWVGGKTGTAQVVDKQTKEYSNTDFLASFIGFFPDSSARWAMLIMVYAPKTVSWGGEVAAPIFGEVAEKIMRYLHVTPNGQDIVIEKEDLPLTAQYLKTSTPMLN